MSPLRALALTDDDRRRAARISEVVARGSEALGELLPQLDDPSWAVRRAVVAGLAALGNVATKALCDILERHRDSEARIAAAVDALAASRGDVDGSVLQLAGSKDPAIVCDAVQVLGRRRSSAAVPRLSELTLDPDDNVALAAIEALGRVGDDASITPLIAAVESRNFFRTFPAIDVLGRTANPRAVKPLLALLSEHAYASEAVRALGRVGDAAAVTPLAGLLERGNGAMVRTAAVALAEIEDRNLERFGRAGLVAASLENGEFRGATRRIVQALGQADGAEQSALCRVLGWIGGETAILALIDLLAMGDQASAPVAAEALGRLGRAAEPILLTALRDSDSDRRLMILPLLSHNSEVVEPVATCLADPNPSVRALACDALARIGQTSVVPRLFALLGDTDARVSQSAIAAIQSLGSPATERLALEAGRSTDARVRRAGLRIIAYFGYPSALDILIGAIEDPDERIRDAAMFGLPSMDSARATEALLRATTHTAPRTRAAAMRAIGQAPKHPRTILSLRAGLHDPDAWVRYFACQALSRLKDEGAAEMISALLGDPAGQVRVAVVEALARLRGVRALGALHSAATGSDADVQRAALLGLGSVKDPSSLPILLGAVAGADAATRLVALSALAGYEGGEIDRALGDRMSDGDESVRSAAIALLGGREGEEATRALLQHLHDQGLRARIVSALAQPVQGRVATLVDALRGASAETSAAIVSALSRSQRSEAARALEEAFATGDVTVRRAAAPALAAMATPSSRALLLQAATSDPDEEVRQIAAVAAAG